MANGIRTILDFEHLYLKKYYRLVKDLQQSGHFRLKIFWATFVRCKTLLRYEIVFHKHQNILRTSLKDSCVKRSCYLHLFSQNGSFNFSWTLQYSADDRLHVPLY